MVNNSYNFILKANTVHCGKYSYNKVDYKNNKEKVCIICPEHGEFWQKPKDHLSGNGCPKCANKLRGRRKRFTKEEFVNKAKKIHGDAYDYSKVVYKNIDTNVIIICKDHGEFKQTPMNHINGQGCPKCHGRGLTTEEIITKFTTIHGNKYDYSKVEYSGSNKKVCIICPEHGEFWQTPSKHLLGQNCPICSNIIKRGQISERDIKSLPYSICEMEIYRILTETIGEDDVLLRKNNVNILLPKKKIGITCHSLLPNNKWDCRDITDKCKYNGINVIQIFEDEYNNNKDVVISKLKHIIGVDRICMRIMARKCSIREIDNLTAKEFLTKYHIQGYSNTTLSFGAYYQNVLIGVMCFTKTSDNDVWILNRFATDDKYICQGIGGKLFKYFVKNYNPRSVKSFADRRWTINKENNLYTKIGFKLTKELNPEYRYINKSKPKERIHKFNLRKKTLHNRYNLPIDMTEKEIAKELGLVKIWDCGLYKYEWERK